MSEDSTLTDKEDQQVHRHHSLNAAHAAAEYTKKAKEHLMNVMACLTPNDVHAGRAAGEALVAIDELEHELVFVKDERQDALDALLEPDDEIG